MERLNKYGVSMVPAMKSTIQGKKLDRAVQLVNEGKRFVLVLDNIDWEFKVHDMRPNKQN